MPNEDRDIETGRERRDPSYPAATATGAGGGAAAGAGIGAIVGGPPGAAVGGIAGAVVGGVAGTGSAERSTGVTEGREGRTDFDSFIGYDVVDLTDQKIGTLSCLWTDHTGEPAFLGVKTGWLGFGKNHVVPAHRAELNSARKTIRLPYSEDQVKNAPSYDADMEMTEATEQEIYDYYGLAVPRRTETARTSTPSAPASTERAGDATVQLSEEELKVGKRQVEAGGVRLRKIIRTETVNQPVELQREDIVIERVPARERQPTGRTFEEEEVFIPLRHEEAVVEKESHVREEVRARRTSETERQTISGEVRKEDVEVEREQERERDQERGL